MAKYHPQIKINKNKGNNMWAKIKCWFGFCNELTEIKMREKLAVDSTYKVEPKVMTVTIKDPDAKEIIKKATKAPKVTKTTVKKPRAKVKTIKATDLKKTKEKVEKAELEVKVEAVKKVVKKAVKKVPKSQQAKVKRHWFNNGTAQKLVAEGSDTEKLGKVWKKGKLKKVSKVSKGDK